MNSFTVHIWDDEGQKCRLYTVTKDGASANETDKFLLKYENGQHREALQELVQFIIHAIGDDHGAIDELMNRFENEVTGLPPKGKVRLVKQLYHYPHFPLRLYALRITDDILILFNGGVKDGATNQNSSLHHNWIEAYRFAKRINEALDDGIIMIDTEAGKLFDDDGNEEIFID